MKHLWLRKILSSEKRLDRGKVLMSIPFDQVCPSSIKVVYNGSSFNVKISEDKSPVEVTWVNQFLGLKREGVQSNFNSPESEPLKNGSRKEDGEASSFCFAISEKDKLQKDVRGQHKPQVDVTKGPLG